VSIDRARQVLIEAIASRVFPGAVVDAGASGGVIWREALGSLTFDEASAVSEDTPFDLASLTKPIATTGVAMQLISDGRLALDDRVSVLFAEWRGADREPVTVQDLLEHASGLSPRLVDPPPELRREFEHEICTMRLDYVPRSKSVYSDLDFILLGFALADRGGASLASQFDAVCDRLGVREPGLGRHGLTFTPDAETRRRAAPTLPMSDDIRRGRRLIGEVHDNYASALGGVAGHAGLFGTAPAVGAYARAVLRAWRGDGSIPPPLSPALVKRAVTRSTVPGSSRALGWDTMLPTSSCGVRMSASAFGHVGFTGTSLWIDPARDRYFVLLTNRVCGGGTTEEMSGVRRSFHDELGDL
jgi:CubicO group peptidase (beta-lactamase class C family)